MSRGPRIQEPNGIYHVTARGLRRMPIFHDEIDWRRYIGILSNVVETYVGRAMPTV